FMVIEIDLHNRRSRTRPQELDFAQTESSILSHLAVLDAQFLLQMTHDIFKPAEQTTERAADLQVILSDILGKEHRVEGHRLVDLYRVYIEPFGYVLDGGFGYPSLFVLSQMQKRQQCRMFARILLYRCIYLRFGFG